MSNFAALKPSIGPGQRDYVTKIAAALDALDAIFNTAATFGGTLAVAGVASFAAGAVGAPSITFGDATTGLYRTAANQIGVSISGTQRGLWTSTGLNNAAIGATTPSTGAHTTISATGVITSTVATGTAPFTIASTTVVGNLNVSQLLGATWSAPGAIGGGTPGSGAFTTGTFSSTLSATQLTSTIATGTAPLVVSSTTVVGNLNVSQLLGATWAAPGTIGSGTPNTGVFTTFSATGALHTFGVSGNNLTKVIVNGNTGSGFGAYIELERNGVYTHQIGHESAILSNNNSHLFYYSNTGCGYKWLTAGAKALELMAGQVMVGAAATFASANTKLEVNNTGASSIAAYLKAEAGSTNPTVIVHNATASTDNLFMQFSTETAGVGTVRGTIDFNRAGVLTRFNTTSDRRLKTDLGRYLDTHVLRALAIHRFTWKETGNEGIGVFAQAAYEVYSDAVSVGGEDVSKRPWSVDYSKYVPHLIVGWQDHEQRIAKLETLH